MRCRRPCSACFPAASRRHLLRPAAARTPAAAAHPLPSPPRPHSLIDWQAGIGAGLRALKGGDRAAGRALGGLGAQGLLDVHLAVLEKHETGTAVEDGWGRGHRGGWGGGWGKRRRCAYDWDEDGEGGEEYEDEDDEDAGRYSMEDVR